MTPACETQGRARRPALRRKLASWLLDHDAATQPNVAAVRRWRLGRQGTAAQLPRRSLTAAPTLQPRRSDGRDLIWSGTTPWHLPPSQVPLSGLTGIESGSPAL